jgi:imidazolonepropionase-like amidohydrolase
VAPGRRRLRRDEEQPQEAVGDAASTKIPAGAQAIDLSRSTVLPGLIDGHTHIFLQGEDPAEGGYDAQLLKHGLAFRAARAAVSARRALEQGFTTIRDVETEGAGYGDVGIKEAIEAGYIPGPRMFVVTRAISTTGGYNLEGYAPEVDVPKGAQIVDGPVEARKAAREQLDHGADWIKVYMTHRSWVDAKGNLVSQPTLTVEELKADVESGGVDTVIPFGAALRVSGRDAAAVEATLAPVRARHEFTVERAPTSLEDVFVNLMQATTDNVR